MKITNIKGKPYVEVNERLIFFRNSEQTKDWSLTTEFVHLDDKSCVIKAVISDSVGRIIATGVAREVNGDGMVNKTSYVENCETSAWGRALGNLGIGIDTAVSSADEVANAIKQQEQMAKPAPKVVVPKPASKDKKPPTIEEVIAELSRIKPAGFVLNVDRVGEILTPVYEDTTKPVPSMAKIIKTFQDKYADEIYTEDKIPY